MSRRAISLIAHFPFSSAILFLLLLFELLFFSFFSLAGRGSDMPAEE